MNKGKGKYTLESRNLPDYSASLNVREVYLPSDVSFYSFRKLDFRQESFDSNKLPLSFTKRCIGYVGYWKSRSVKIT